LYASVWSAPSETQYHCIHTEVGGVGSEGVLAEEQIGKQASNDYLALPENTDEPKRYGAAILHLSTIEVLAKQGHATKAPTRQPNNEKDVHAPHAASHVVNNEIVSS
jgi:hypothetical protein